MKPLANRAWLRARALSATSRRDWAELTFASGAADGERQIGGVETGEQLARPDVVADVDEALDHLAADPEAEPGVSPRLHRAGEDDLPRRRGGLDLHHLDRATGSGARAVSLVHALSAKARPTARAADARRRGRVLEK